MDNEEVLTVFLENVCIRVTLFKFHGPFGLGRFATDHFLAKASSRLKATIEKYHIA